jgi:hypothetical protein
VLLRANTLENILKLASTGFDVLKQNTFTEKQIQNVERRRQLKKTLAAFLMIYLFSAKNI